VGIIDTLAQAVIRRDGWVNVLAGLGLAGRDRGAGTAFDSPPLLDLPTLAALYHHDDICRTVVSIYPEEALRRGIPIKGEDAQGKVTRALRTLNARVQIQRGAIWGRCFGGGVVVIGARDGKPCDTPLAPGQHPIDSLDVYDRRQAFRESCYDDIRSGTSFGDAKLFRITPVRGGTFYVHRSRCLVFGGAETAPLEREQNAGWDYSVLQVVYEVIKQFANGHLALGNMLTDASQAVMKIRGLIAAVAGGQKEALSRRLQLVDLSRSVARAVMLDADGGEEFTKVATSFSDVPAAIDRLANRLAAATRIPVTILMGQAPAGLNATGESDVRTWYDRVASYREHEIAPHVEKLLSILAPGSSVAWPALWQPTDTEKALNAKTVAETDSLYIADNVHTPEEIAAARHYVPHDESLRAIPVAPSPPPSPKKALNGAAPPRPQA
jgi:phage-related protein (TIGR01555 family)